MKDWTITADALDSIRTATDKLLESASLCVVPDTSAFTDTLKAIEVPKYDFSEVN